MPTKHDYVTKRESELAGLVRQLKSLESGDERNFERTGAGRQRDITPALTREVASGRVRLLLKREAMGVGVLLGAGSTRSND
jgi:hypothetical protein